MFLEVHWFVPELLATFAAYPDIGLLSLIRGLHVFPLKKPIECWDDLAHSEHMVTSSATAHSTGPPVRGRHRHPAVGRPARLHRQGGHRWTKRSAQSNGTKPTSRIASASAADGRSRRTTTSASGPSPISGSSTLGKNLSQKYKSQILVNGRLFHERWQDVIRSSTRGRRRTWWRDLPREEHAQARAASGRSSACSRRAVCSRACAPPRRSL